MKKSDISPANLSAGVIENEIKSRLSVTAEATVLDSVGSTNSWLCEKQSGSGSDEHKTPDLQVCAAEHQTAGRGRRGKVWYTPLCGVTFSLRFTVPVALAEVGGISLLTGAAVCDSLRQCSVEQAMIKWPNDILVNQAKLVGILVEVGGHTKASTTLIVGIGVNYQRGAEQKKIDQASTDLFDLCNGSPPDRSVLIGHLAAAVYRRCNSGSVPGNMVVLAREWARYDAFAGADIEVNPGTAQVLSGRADGIDDTGRLRIKSGSESFSVSSGDVSVRRA